MKLSDHKIEYPDIKGFTPGALGRSLRGLESSSFHPQRFTFKELGEVLTYLVLEIPTLDVSE